MSERDETREAELRAAIEAEILPMTYEGADLTECVDRVLSALKPGCRFTVEGVECVVAPVAASKAMVDSGVAFALNVSISSDYNWSSYVADLHSAMLRACEEKGDGR